MTTLGAMSFLASGPPDGASSAYLFLYSSDPDADAEMRALAVGLHMRVGAWSDRTHVTVTAHSIGRVSVDLKGFPMPPLQVDPDWTHHVAHTGRIVVIVGADRVPGKATDEWVVEYLIARGDEGFATGLATPVGFRDLYREDFSDARPHTDG